MLAIDYGEKRVGLAISDENREFAFELTIWPLTDFFKNLPGLIVEKEIKKIILGHPLNLQGQPTKKTEEVLKFKDKLQASLENGVELDLIDERLSSKMAEKIAGSSKNIDGLAAQIFLQNYLNKSVQK